MPIGNYKNKMIKGAQFTSFNYDHDREQNDIYPFAIIYLSVDDETAIAIGTDPMSPRDFFEKNHSNSFMLDLSIPPKEIYGTTYYYAKLVISDDKSTNQNPIEIDFTFYSSDHIRYEGRKQVSGPHGGAPRAISVCKNILTGEGYLVIIYNTEDGTHKVQMTPKHMKLKNLQVDSIELVGHGVDKLGASFADYGLTILHNNGNIENCILHLLDRGINIVYLP